MNHVPYWQWLLLFYFLLVAIPVFYVHHRLKKRLQQQKTGLNLLYYVAAVMATAFLMHFICMTLYFQFLFVKK